MKSTLKKLGTLVLAGAVGAALTIGTFSVISHNKTGSFMPPGMVRAAGTNTTTLYTPTTANPDFTASLEQIF